MSIHNSAQQLIGQIGEVTGQLNDEIYCQPLAVLNDSSIGQHIRHTLEFFICLMDGVHTEHINYDERKHDEVIEKDRKIALTVIDSINDFLKKHPADFELNFKANYSVSEEETLDIKSSFYREIAYNIEHAIHHMALIKIGIKSLLPGFKFPDHFGVASSTVRFQMSRKG